MYCFLEQLCGKLCFADAGYGSEDYCWFVLQLPELLNEGAVFGGLNVAPAVDSCFSTVRCPTFMLSQCEISRELSVCPVYGLSGPPVSLLSDLSSPSSHHHCGDKQQKALHCLP